MALALSGLILAAIGMAIDLHLRALQSRRADVEDAQLARAILQRIAEDLRSTVLNKAIDFSSLEGLAPEGLPDGLDLGGGEQAGGAADQSLGATLEEEGFDATQSLAASVVSTSAPGLYGNQYELQVDVSRLPRIDEYHAVLSSAGLASTGVPSGIKTVAYYVAGSDAAEAATASTAFAPDSTGGAAAGSGAAGLVRRELDRAVTQWAADNGNLDSLQTSGTVIAPEVTQLEFRYFDGTEWLTEWDSEQNGALPVAVEIAIVIEHTEQEGASGAGQPSLGSSAVEEAPPIYRLTVYLPMAEAQSEESTELLEEF